MCPFQWLGGGASNNHKHSNILETICFAPFTICSYMMMVLLCMMMITYTIFAKHIFTHKNTRKLKLSSPLGLLLADGAPTVGKRKTF